MWFTGIKMHLCHLEAEIWFFKYIVYSPSQEFDNKLCEFTSILARFIEPRSIRTGLSSSSRSTFVGFRSLSNNNSHMVYVEMAAVLLL